MDAKKPRGAARSSSCFLQLAVSLHIALTVLSIGYLAYRVHFLEERVVHLESELRVGWPELQPSPPHRSRRSASSSNASACEECREACVKLFGAGTLKGIGSAGGSACPRGSHKFENSRIMKNKDYVELLHEWLASVVTAPSGWKLCYRATSHGWSGGTFHSKCDNRGPTITFIRVGEYIFGGFTDKDWQSSGYITSTNSFIFSFKNRDGLGPFMLKVKKKQYAIYGAISYGPVFGIGFDIYIANNAGSNTHSYTNLGDSYMLPSGYRYGQTETRNLLAGSYYFQPDEVEVFYQTKLSNV